MRDNIILKCTECGEENYINTKNKINIALDAIKKLYTKKKNKLRLIFLLENILWKD